MSDLGFLSALSAADFDTSRVQMVRDWARANNQISSRTLTRALQIMDFDSHRVQVFGMLFPLVEDKENAWDCLQIFDFDTYRQTAFRVMSDWGAARKGRPAPKIHIERSRQPKTPKPPKPPKLPKTSSGSRVHLRMGDFDIRQDSTGTYINGKKVDLTSLLGTNDISGCSIQQDSSGLRINGKKVDLESTAEPAGAPENAPQKKPGKDPHIAHNSLLGVLWPLLVVVVVLTAGIGILAVIN